MVLTPGIERAIERCYDAITTPALWAGALDDLAHAMGANVCQILAHEISERQYGHVQSATAGRLNELWNQNSDWITPVYEPRGDFFVRNGYHALIQSHLFTEDEVRHSRYHQEVARPAGCEEWACGIFTVEGRHWCMPFHRDTEAFTPEVLEPVAEVAQHMARIVGISQKLSRSFAENQIFTLEKVRCAALLVGWDGQVKRCNRLASELFCADFGLRGGRLWTSGNRSQAQLTRFMTEVNLASTTDGHLPKPLIISRWGSPWVLIEVMPVTRASRDIFEGTGVILVVSDLTRPTMSDAALLGVVFGLTAAESRLAAAICEGHDINSAAAAFGVSPLTLRGQLKVVFAKTGARRQAELVARVAQIKGMTRH
jgi:DNA-binding CsgD family transcriptional regulator